MKTIKFHDNKNIVSEKVKEAREKANMSQSELAAALQTCGVCIDQQAVSKIERNMRIVTDYELVCLCKVLRVDEKWFLSYCYEVIR